MEYLGSNDYTGPGKADGYLNEVIFNKPKKIFISILGYSYY